MAIVMGRLQRAVVAGFISDGQLVTDFIYIEIINRHRDHPLLKFTGPRALANIEYAQPCRARLHNGLRLFIERTVIEAAVVENEIIMAIVMVVSRNILMPRRWGE